MTAMGIQQQADNVQELIETSRSSSADGHFIDISEVEEKMTRLFDTVSKNPEACLGVDVGKIAGSLANLMGDLDNLENDLDRQHQSLSTENTVSPNSAAQAYQS